MGLCSRRHGKVGMWTLNGGRLLSGFMSKVKDSVKIFIPKVMFVQMARS
jgi:hypothetical protein